MNVTVVSIQAVLRGRTPIVWLGDIELEEMADLLGGLGLTLDPEKEVEICEALFRYFNRVDDEDIDRLEDIGYTLPSLSVGDLIAWDHVTYRVSGSGFERLTDSSEYAMALTGYTLRTMNPDRTKVD